MSIWQRIFKKGPKTATISGRRSLKEQYQHKVQGYLEIMAASNAAGEIIALMRTAQEGEGYSSSGQMQADCAALLGQTRRALDLLNDFAKHKQPELVSCFEDLALKIDQALAASGETRPEDIQSLWHQLNPLIISKERPDASPSLTLADCACIQDLLDYLEECRLKEMFCLSLRSPVTKKDAVSLVTGRMVPILVIDAGGGLGCTGSTVDLEAVTSIPYRAFLTGMMSIPWPKARPLNMKGFISVVGVTSTTPRAEDQLQKTSFALLSRNYMNFSLCLGYHASTIEAYLGDQARNNYIRFHYQGGAASVERRVRRLRLIEGILTRLGFKVEIQGDLLDGRRVGDQHPEMIRLLEILGRLEVYTKQMDMVMTDDDVVWGYVEDFLKQHC